MSVPRPEHPRPRLVRDRWTSLNGPWGFAVDDDDRGLAERWYAGPPSDPFTRTITVPFAPQTPLSGIGDRSPHDVVWYARTFDDVRAGPGERLLLHFGAVDHAATVWVNGVQVADHVGGHTPFTSDVSHVVTPTGNAVVVRAADPLDDLETPRGKQYWHERSENIFYTATTGIWQSVWLEPVPAAHVAALHLTPDLDAAAVDVEAELAGPAVGGTLRVVVTLGDLVLADDRLTVTGPRVRHRVGVVPPRGAVGADVADHRGVAVWSPEQPTLHDVRVELEAAGATDVVTSYVGVRKVEARDGRVWLNDRPCYQRLVLDQGYFPGGGLTAPTDEDLRRDIELAKDLGFNGARKHQKVEDPRWLHHADRLGFLVWGEMANAYQFSPRAAGRLTREWQEVVARDRDHACVVAWVPMNESWGVPALASDRRQRDLLLALYHLTRALDPTRPVVSNDGWEHAVTDLLTVHDYGDPDALAVRYADRDRAVAATPAGRPLYTVGHAHRGEPVLLTEFGGVALEESADTWGYRTVADGDALAERYRELLAAVAASGVLAGFCYTQLTDVEQEANGLLTADRKPKADVAALREATLLPGDDRPD